MNIKGLFHYDDLLREYETLMDDYRDLKAVNARLEQSYDRLLFDSENADALNQSLRMENARLECDKAQFAKRSAQFENERKTWQEKREHLHNVIRTLKTQRDQLQQNYDLMKQANETISALFECQANRTRQLELDLAYERRAEKWVYDLRMVPGSWRLAGWMPDNAAMRRIGARVPIPTTGFTEEGDEVDCEVTNYGSDR